MALHHRHKQRLLTTIVTLIVLVLCVDLFFLLDGVMSQMSDLLVTFGFGILLLTIYHFYNYEHCHEYITMINNLTQIYFGAIIILAIIFTFLLKAFGVELETALLVSAIGVVLVVFLTLGSYDRYLEGHLGRRFPINAPAPRRAASSAGSVKSSAPKKRLKKVVKRKTVRKKRL